MLRITIQNDTALLLEGKLAGEWVAELRKVWARIQAGIRKQGVVVSLSGVSGIDAEGRQLLTEIHAAGGVLTGSGLFARTLVAEITRTA
jgi:hypothetical protein